jgi:hypothetical protein
MFRNCQVRGGSKFVKKRDPMIIYAYTQFNTHLIPYTKNKYPPHIGKEPTVTLPKGYFDHSIIV